MRILLCTFLAGALLLTGCGYQAPEQHSVFSAASMEELLGEWIETRSPTYAYDGFDLSDGTLIEERDNGGYIFEYTFTSRSAGYGDRTDQLTAQVLTPHTMRLTTFNGDLFSAITDGVYDEYNAQYLDAGSGTF